MMQKVVLLVEDNADDELLARKALEKCADNIRLVVVRDGEEALDYLFTRGGYAELDAVDVPQLVVLDLKLPKINGLQVLQSIREKQVTRHIPVVILTSSDQESDVATAYSIGVNSYLKKPVDFNSFLNLASQLNKYWLGLNVLPSSGRE